MEFSRLWLNWKYPHHISVFLMEVWLWLCVHICPYVLGHFSIREISLKPCHPYQSWWEKLIHFTSFNPLNSYVQGSNFSVSADGSQCQRVSKEWRPHCNGHETLLVMGQADLRYTECHETAKIALLRLQSSNDSNCADLQQNDCYGQTCWCFNTACPSICESWAWERWLSSMGWILSSVCQEAGESPRTLR